MLILVLNCGSSSVKYKLFDMSTELALVAGSIERIGEDDPSLTHTWEGGQLSEPTTACDHEKALARLRAMLVDPLRGGVQEASEISAVGHRVVHGGERFVRSTLVTPEVEQAIEEHSYLAPLHNPSNLEGIGAARQFFPGIPHVAVFDTAFHQSMPRAALERGIRRAELAVEVYAYRIRKYIGAYLAVLGEADAIVFRGGVGENAYTVRHRILMGLERIGIALNPEVNRTTRGFEGDISTEDSPIRILVVPTNEELMIAREAKAIASVHLVGAESTL